MPRSNILIQKAFTANDFAKVNFPCDWIFCSVLQFLQNWKVSAKGLKSHHSNRMLQEQPLELSKIHACKIYHVPLIQYPNAFYPCTCTCTYNYAYTCTTRTAVEFIKGAFSSKSGHVKALTTQGSLMSSISFRAEVTGKVHPTFPCCTCHWKDNLLNFMTLFLPLNRHQMMTTFFSRA